MQSFNTQEGSISSHNRKLHEAFKKDSLQGVNALESDGINITCSGKSIMNTTKLLTGFAMSREINGKITAFLSA